MTELLANAWKGWQQFTEAGKLAALFLASLLFLWLGGKYKTRKSFFVYTALMTVCCIFPVTAALLMLYQTKFYDYVWIWSTVPMTAVTAWAGTELLDGQWQGFRIAGLKRGLPVTALLLAMILLCGGVGNDGYDRSPEGDLGARAREVLQAVTSQQQEGACLWAPGEILEYAREADPSVRLLYGRNMWDIALNAYTYDTYPQELKDLYLWIENVDETGEAVVTDDQGEKEILWGEDCVRTAAWAGVTDILLPDRIESEKAEEYAAILGGKSVQVEGYYLLSR